MTAKHDSNPDMPYERFSRYGQEALTNTELIAILLRTGSREKGVLELADQVLRLRHNPKKDLSVLYDISKEELMQLHGIGEVKAVRLLAVLELSKRLSQESASGSGESLVCDAPSTIAGYYMESLRHEKQERVLVLMLDNRLALIRSQTLTIGTANCSLCSPRDVFAHAVKSGAVYIILMHNHPSGDPTPSTADFQLTERVRDLGVKMEIPLLDHLIIGDKRYYSMKEEGFLTKKETVPGKEDHRY